MRTLVPVVLLAAFGAPLPVAPGAEPEPPVMLLQGRATADLIAVPQQATPAMQAGAAPSTTTSGPVWFQKMDRNQDGDVSEREFLGPASAFDQLDTNGDEFIDAAEAEGEKEKGQKHETADERR